VSQVMMLHPLAYGGEDKWTAWVADILLHHPLEFVLARQSLRIIGHTYAVLSEQDRSCLAYTVEDRIAATKSGRIVKKPKLKR
jgi:hypothetical protein